ncbi:MAG: matrixin family metalloprotease [Pseudomonadota bacterium]
MRLKKSGIGRGCTALVLSGVFASVGWAGDFKEGKQKAPEQGTTIHHRVWPANAFPLKWRLHKNGVVDNNRRREGGRPISNEEARLTIEAAFQTWADIETANISVAYAGETDTAKAACDLENIVTWSDTESFTEDDPRIARGLTSFYAGPDITLDDTNRKRVPCSAGESRAGMVELVDLPKDRFPDGMRLSTGTILDMDLVWNARVFDFVTTFGVDPQPGVLDMQALATHEFGHMLGLTHTSLKTVLDPHGTNTPTMTVNPVDPGAPKRRFQLNMRSLGPDDIVAAGRAYPGPGFYPGGTEPFQTGEIKGRIKTNGGKGVKGVRVWLYDANEGVVEFASGNAKYDEERVFVPLYETFTATGEEAGDQRAGAYSFKGIPPGRYFVCVQPWSNSRLPGDRDLVQPTEGTYNWTTAHQSGSNFVKFRTKCHEDVRTGGFKPPRFYGKTDRMLAVKVASGKTTADVNISVKPR